MPRTAEAEAGSTLPGASHHTTVCADCVLWCRGENTRIENTTGSWKHPARCSGSEYVDSGQSVQHSSSHNDRHWMNCCSSSSEPVNSAEKWPNTTQFYREYRVIAREAEWHSWTTNYALLHGICVKVATASELKQEKNHPVEKLFNQHENNPFFPPNYFQFPGNYR